MIEHNSDRASSLLVTTAVIMFFASIPIGIFIVTFIHQSFYLDQAHWFFDSPMSSYITMVTMLLVIPVVLISIAIYMSRSEESRKRTSTLLMASLLTAATMLLVGYLALDNYYYMDRDGLHYDELGKLKTTYYSWDDLTAVKQVNKNDGGTLMPEKVIFSYSDRKIELPLTKKLQKEIGPVIGFIENEKGIKLVMENITTK